MINSKITRSIINFISSFTRQAAYAVGKNGLHGPTMNNTSQQGAQPSQQRAFGHFQATTWGYFGNKNEPLLLLKKEHGRSILTVILKEEIIPREGNSGGCSAGKSHTICCYFVCLWVYCDTRKGIIVLHVKFG